MEIAHPDSERKPSARSRELLDTLRELFPAAFNDRFRPLKIGIHNDVIERLGELPVRDLKNAFRLHAGTARYHRNVIEGAVRVDLDGNPAGVVTAAEAAHSLATVAGIEAACARAWEQRNARRTEWRQQLKNGKTAPADKPSGTSKLSLGDLRAAWAARRSGASVGASAQDDHG